MAFWRLFILIYCLKFMIKGGLIVTRDGRVAAS